MSEPRWVIDHPFEPWEGEVGDPPSCDRCGFPESEHARSSAETSVPDYRTVREAAIDEIVGLIDDQARSNAVTPYGDKSK